MRLVRPLLTVAIAALAGVAFAGPAHADATVPLNQTKNDKTVLASTFESQRCKDERFAPRTAGEDGWHFILPGTDGNFVKITLTFKDLGGNTVVVEIPDADDNPYKNDFYDAGDDGKHAYLFTPAGWTLTAGSAVITNSADFFTLSHTCGGTPDTSTPTPGGETPTPGGQTPTPGGQTPTPGTTPGGPGVTPSSSGQPGLPVTGAAVTVFAAVGLALVVGGAGTLFLVRRRRDLPTEV
ncbi:LPXTG cell wall anchor domain-containing protein [Catellatospora citrea]|uniref:LPXTG cell wall anchor domain-containing protein n=1 Tax=Catellatospora citrea TaxID=53366 RepID=UPI0033FAFFD2